MKSPYFFWGGILFLPVIIPSSLPQGLNLLAFMLLPLLPDHLHEASWCLHLWMAHLLNHGPTIS
jgi:hypothetical protein